MWDIKANIYPLASYLASRTKSLPKVLLEIPLSTRRIGIAFINKKRNYMSRLNYLNLSFAKPKAFFR